MTHKRFRKIHIIFNWVVILLLLSLILYFYPIYLYTSVSFMAIVPAIIGFCVRSLVYEYREYRDVVDWEEKMKKKEEMKREEEGTI